MKSKQKIKQKPSQKYTIKIWLHNVCMVLTMSSVILTMIITLYTRSLSYRSLKASAERDLNNINIDDFTEDAELLYMGKHHIVQTLLDSDFRRIYFLIYKDRVLYNLGIQDKFEYPDSDEVLDQLFNIVADYSDLADIAGIREQTVYIANISGFTDLLLQTDTEGGRYMTLSEMFPDITPTEISSMTFLAQLLYNNIMLYVSLCILLFFSMITAFTSPNFSLLLHDLIKSYLIPLVVIFAVFLNAYDINKEPFFQVAYQETLWIIGISIGVIIVIWLIGYAWRRKILQTKLGKTKKEK